MNIILGLLTRLAKSKMLEYMKIVEDKLINMFSTPTVIRKIKDVNYKGYVHDKLREELNSIDTCNTEAIFGSLRFKKSQETIAESLKLLPQKLETGIKILTLKNY